MGFLADSAWTIRAKKVSSKTEEKIIDIFLILPPPFL
jgi:hypothetical protein